MSSILKSYRVLDLTDERGLHCGQILADLGADVIQVEPPAGSSARRRGPFFGEDGDPEGSLFWWAYTRNKRGLTLDLESDEGRERFRALVATADFLIESDKPGAMAARGLGYDDLAALNPGLIYVSISPYGQTGPKSAYEATDLTVHAASGAGNYHGDDDRAPVRCSIPQSFLYASSDAAAGAMAAHHERARSGLGQHVTCSAQISVTSTTMYNVLASAWESMEPRRANGAAKAGPFELRMHYPASDGWLNITMLSGSAFGPYTQKMAAVAHELGFGDEAMRDEDWGVFFDRVLKGERPFEDFLALVETVAECTKTKTKAEWLALAMEKGLLIAPVATVQDLLEGPQFEARGYVEEIEHPELGRSFRYPGAFAKFTDTPISTVHRAPRIGEHNAEILEELEAARRAPSVYAKTPREPARALDDIKILDFTWVLAGPASTRLLCDLGAEVIRVESPTRIDTARTVGPNYRLDPDPNAAGLFVNANAGKRGIALDLSKPESKEVILDLVRWADVVTESFSPKAMKAWGLDYESLKQVKPDLIMLSSCLMGQTGPHAKLAGYGTMGGAFAGFSEVAGWEDRPPAGLWGAYTDFMSPRYSVCAILAALEHRRQTGRGQYIDQSQIEVSAHYLAPALLDWDANQRLPKRIGNADPHMAPHGVFAASGDDRWVAVACQSDAAWPGLCKTIGRDDLASDATLATLAGRQARNEELEAVITAWTSTRTGLESEAEFQRNGVAAQSVHDSADYIADPQIQHMKYLVDVEVGSFGKLPVEGPRMNLSRSLVEVRGPAPSTGEHTNDVFEQVLGYDEEKVTELVIAGVLG